MRKLLSWAPVVLFMVLAVVAFDWMDYHVKGESWIVGLNSRCTDAVGHVCLKLDAGNLSWDAKAAIWLDQGLRVLTVAVAILGMAAGMLLLAAYLYDRAKRGRVR